MNAIDTTNDFLRAAIAHRNASSCPDGRRVFQLAEANEEGASDVVQRITWHAPGGEAVFEAYEHEAIALAFAREGALVNARRAAVLRLPEAMSQADADAWRELFETF
jgi:hypothetical protein